MFENDQAAEQTRVSLLTAAAQLSSAVDASEIGGPVSDLYRAIRQAMNAVEYELGCSTDQGTLAGVAKREPRLRPALEQLEVGLAETLVLLWQTGRMAPADAPASPELLGLARRLRRLADKTTGILHESMAPVGGEN